MEARLTKRKLLGEFLLEQQEPCALEAFFLERGCSRSLFNGSFVQRSSSWKRKKGVIQFSKLLRAIQHQNGFFNGSIMKAEHRCGGERVGKCSSSESFSTSHGQTAAKQDGLSFPSSATVYISCNESSEAEENPNSQNQDGLESEIQESIQENEHLSSCHYSNSKKEAQQTKGLLFDCVMEVIQTHESRKGREKGGLAAEEIGKLICKRVMEWGTTSGSETRTTVTEIVYDNLLDREEEQVRGDSLTQKMEIASGIADGILGDIRDEILAEMSLNTSPCNKSY